MQIAAILSDLTSLLVCENRPAALNLVSASPRSTVSSSGTPDPSVSSQRARDSASQELDLARAYRLLQLHSEVKEAYSNSGEDEVTSEGPALADLRKAREDVRRAIAELGEGMGKRTNGDTVGQVADQEVLAPEGTDLDEVAAWS